VDFLIVDFKEADLHVYLYLKGEKIKNLGMKIRLIYHRQIVLNQYKNDYMEFCNSSLNLILNLTFWSSDL